MLLLPYPARHLDGQVHETSTPLHLLPERKEKPARLA